jgi:antitoxin (DNA-binding transcriptional repressor) of toxin-antitoxin stability system
MSTIGARELRQNASEVLRAVEAGEPTTVTVDGRAVAPTGPTNGDPADRAGVRAHIGGDRDLPVAETFIT